MIISMSSGCLSRCISPYKVMIGWLVNYLIIVQNDKQLMQQDHNLDGQPSSSPRSSRYPTDNHRSWCPTSPFSSLSKQALTLISILLLILGFCNWVFISHNFPANASGLKPTTSLQQQSTNNGPSINIQQSLKSGSVRHSTPVHKKHNQASAVDRLPKVFWIYTEKEIEIQPYDQQLYLHYIRETVSKNGYEVRVVNSWNAYDYLNENTIARISLAMQKSKVDEPIHALLKMALLIENGGVIMNQLDYGVAGSSFDWIERMFNYKGKDYEIFYGCKPSKSYVYMLAEPGSGILQKRYSDSFMAAVPGSLLLTEAFHLMINFVLTGSLPWHPELIKTNPDTGVGYIDSLFEQSINIVMNRYLIDFSPTEENLCNKYGLQMLKNKNTVDYASLPEDKKILLLTTGDLETELERVAGIKQASLLRGLNTGPIRKITANLLENIVNNQHHQIQDYFPGSLLFKILNAPGNKEIFLDTFPDREVELCAIITKELSKPEIDRSLLQLLSHQTYKKWKQVMFVSDMNILPKVEDDRLIFLASSSNPVRNIEIAATQHCSPSSYAILLNPGQKFSSINALAEIAQATSPRGVVAAFITLDNHGASKTPKQEHITLSHDEDGSLAASDQMYEAIANHMRIFSVQSFRTIPQFALHDAFGTYPKQRLIFLLPLLEMVSQQISDPAQLYLIKRYGLVWDIPRKSVLIKHDIKIKNMLWQSFKAQELPQRKPAESIKQTLRNIINWKIPFDKIVVLNRGEKFDSIENKKGPELIPKVIHQVWLGGKTMPPTKQYFLGKTKVMYPSFQIKLWSEANITKQSFPLTYSLIKNLIAFNQSKSVATAVDIARYQLLYHEGGFWKDSAMNVLRPIFDKLTKYKLATAVDSSFRYLGLSGAGFFGMVPGLQNMKRIIDFRNINRMRIYHSSTGPQAFDFTSFLLEKEEQDPEILLLSSQSFYPATVNLGSDLCVKALADIDSHQNFEINENGYVILSNCQDSYPVSFGVLHPQFIAPLAIRHS